MTLTFRSINEKMTGRFANERRLTSVLRAKRESPGSLVIIHHYRGTDFPVARLTVEGKCHVLLQDAAYARKNLLNTLEKCIEGHGIRRPLGHGPAYWAKLSIPYGQRVMVPISNDDVYDQDAQHLTAKCASNF